MLPLNGPGLFLFEQNIPLAIAIVVGSSVAYAGGSTMQHLAVSRLVHPDADNRAMNLRQLWRLIRTPLWLLGLLTIFIGASAHIVALMMAPVTVVQPVGILAVPWAVLMSARIHRHTITRAMWLSVAVTIAGIVVFTLFSASRAADDTRLDPVAIAIGCIVIYLIGAALGLLGWKGPEQLRCLMWASGGSFFYGLSAGMVKATSEVIKHDDFHGQPVFWVVAPFLVMSYAIGGFMIQQALANGPAEITVGSMTTTDPIVAVAFGLIVLGEGVRITPWAGVGMALAGVFAVWGVVLLSKHHPDAAARRPVAQGAEVDGAVA
ncbi:DMT family transporter [Micropruina sonneratiae]|uniref:DMT family transporter n=1 Tax=Micropruina sonneratiae TaxID=2986940 RepID=UPI0022269E3A|nr:DMT family transporter [Micropruina sp. KQZ13P-5]MCW3158400.1 DMT family transporter [Micropruina sp. KQZ13P-5]